MKAHGHSKAGHLTESHKHAFAFSSTDFDSAGEQGLACDSHRAHSPAEKAALYYVRENHKQRMTGKSPVSTIKKLCTVDYQSWHPDVGRSLFVWHRTLSA